MCYSTKKTVCYRSYEIRRRKKQNRKKERKKEKKGNICKKKSCKDFEKKSGCLIFKHEIEAFRGVFLKENRGTNPLI